MSFQKHTKNGIIYYTCDLFDKAKIPHFFAASRGGVSEGDFSSLNISTSRKGKNGCPDKIENVRKNLSLGLDIVGSCENKAVMMKQIHSSDVQKATTNCTSAFEGSDFQPCDGVFATRGMDTDTLCVKTADCVPVLLYDTKNDTACAIHAGWRGTCDNICGKAVEKMKSLYPDADVIAAIGPCILDCCYEVNEIVYDKVMQTANSIGISKEKVEECFPKKYFADGEEKFRVSLPKINRMFLEKAGVAPENIEESGLCTCCHKDMHGNLFFSHRASHGFSGTQMSIIKVRDVH